MILSRGRKPELRKCAKCGKDHPQTLFNAQGFCVYCASAQVMEETPKRLAKEYEKVEDTALAARRREHLKLQAKKRSALGKLKKQAEEQEMSAADAAKQEMARQHLLPFIMRFNESYEPGWGHKDICDKLEWFSAAVAAKESPPLMIFMPPRHGKSETGSRSFPAWHLGNYPEHEFIGCSYGSDLANGFSRKVRDLVKDPAHHAVFDKTVFPAPAGISLTKLLSDPSAPQQPNWLGWRPAVLSAWYRYSGCLITETPHPARLPHSDSVRYAGRYHSPRYMPAIPVRRWTGCRCGRSWPTWRACCR